MKATIDILRSEKRFLVLPENLPDFLAGISAFLERKVFSDKKIARTIYFNNDDYPVPWGYSIKARKYLPAFSQEIFLDPQEVYRIEIKSTGKEDIRAKIQKELPLGEIAQFILDNLGLNLRPYAVNEYLRTHFVSREKAELLRLTVDQNVKYGLFEETSKPATWVGDEDFVRIELKAAPEYQNSNEYQKVMQLIANHAPLPVISKREHAFSFIGLVIDTKGKSLKKEIRDCEIEAKFLVRHSNPAALLLALKRYLQKNSTGYEVAKHYPYTQEGASINHYWSCEDKNGEIMEGMKLMFIGQKVKPVFKKETQVLPDPYGLNCVLERKELKDQPFVFTRRSFENFLRKAEKSRGKLDYIGYLHRSRRAFWPESKETKRIYHISLDRCQSLDGRVGWQMEIEYTGRYLEHLKGGDAEGLKLAIKSEVAEFSNEILLFCNKEGQCLIPTTLTKFDWLRG